jgi:hypothetical protein
MGSLPDIKVAFRAENVHWRDESEAGISGNDFQYQIKRCLASLSLSRAAEATQRSSFLDVSFRAHPVSNFGVFIWRSSNLKKGDVIRP